jgi:hypothetical protein
MAQLLTFDPDARISVEDALGSPFLKRYHNPAQEPPCEPFDFDFEVGWFGQPTQPFLQGPP